MPGQYYEHMLVKSQTLILLKHSLCSPLFYFLAKESKPIIIIFTFTADLIMFIELLYLFNNYTFVP